MVRWLKVGKGKSQPRRSHQLLAVLAVFPLGLPCCLPQPKGGAAAGDERPKGDDRQARAAPLGPRPKRAKTAWPRPGAKRQAATGCLRHCAAKVPSGPSAGMPAPPPGPATAAPRGSAKGPADKRGRTAPLLEALWRRHGSRATGAQGLPPGRRRSRGDIARPAGFDIAWTPGPPLAASASCRLGSAPCPWEKRPTSSASGVGSFMP